MSALDERIDLRLAVTDQVVGDQPVKIKCRMHPDKTASLAVYADNLHCFGCGFHLDMAGGDLPGHIHPLAYLLGISEREVVQVAKRYTNESLDRYRERAAQEARMDPLPRSLAVIYNKVLNGPERRHRLEWFYDRGLRDSVISDPDVLLGHDGLHFVIPIFDRESHLVSLRYRMDPAYCSEQDIAKHKYLGTKGRNGLYLYPEPALARTMEGDTVYICEGELDALRLWQDGKAAVSVTNGAGQVEKIPALLRERYPHINELVIATDQDEAGEEAAKRTLKAVMDLGFSARRWYWTGAKDVTEHLQRTP
jgi:DNA primase